MFRVFWPSRRRSQGQAPHEKITVSVAGIAWFVVHQFTAIHFSVFMYSLLGVMGKVLEENGDLVPTIFLVLNKFLLINGLACVSSWQYRTWVPFAWACFLNASLKSWFCMVSGGFVNYLSLAISPGTYRLKVLNTNVKWLKYFIFKLVLWVLKYFYVPSEINRACSYVPKSPIFVVWIRSSHCKSFVI